MGSDLFWAAVRLLICLPLVIGLIYLLLRFGLYRQFLPVRAGRYVRVVEQVPLGPKTVVSLVKVCDRCYLLGHGEGTVTILKEINEALSEEPAVPVFGFEQGVASKIRELKRRRAVKR
ncbi:MAG TPA: flagellar biosynthetic protein FliO [Desulfotomaculum sp.]|nr:flagellar biosynthetic protein FliO [Desulfotomaculum sp.]